MTNITDKKNIVSQILLPSMALGAFYPAADFLMAGHMINADSDTTAGKKLGAVLVSNSTVDWVLMMAGGDLPLDVWYGPDGIPVQPAYEATYPLPTQWPGTDSKPNLNKFDGQAGSISALPCPVVSSVDLAKQDHPVNLYEKSGKREGSMVIRATGDVLTYVIATGSLPESVWIGSDAVNTTPLVPARVSTSVPGSDNKPLVLENKVINCVDFPVVAAADLADLDYTPIYNEEQREQGLINSSLIVDTGTSLALFYGVVNAGAAPVLWIDLSGILPDINPA
jgi:hypothetical protein